LLHAPPLSAPLLLVVINVIANLVKRKPGKAAEHRRQVKAAFCRARRRHLLSSSANTRPLATRASISHTRRAPQHR
jgi:hypothetical protein